MVQDKIRLKFIKKGRMKFISHLDLVRTMASALSRAKIPVYYSEGFNPRPKMVFGLTVPVSCESICEFLDIKLTRAIDEEELLCRLNGQFPEDLKFLEVYERKSEFTSIASALYEIKIYGDILNCEELSEILQGPVMINKKTKKGFIDVDIMPNVLSYEISPENSAEGITLVIKTLLSARPDSYANPVHLLSGIAAKSGKVIDDYDIMRICVYDDKGEEFR